MKITKISSQKNRKGWSSVFVDGKFSFSLPDSKLDKSELKIGTELSAADLDAWKKQSDTAKLKYKVIKYIGIRPRSEQEIRDYLKRKKVGDDEIDHVVDYLYEHKLLDDLEFAKQWVDYRNATKPMSRIKLIYELRKKGISSEIIDQAVDREDVDEKQMIRRLIKSKGSRYKDEQKLMAYLARQGFSYGLIKDVLSDEEDSIN